MSTEPRRPGKLRNGSSKAAEPAAAPVRTAQQVLAHLQDLRDTQGGYLVPPPAGIGAARLVELPDNNTGDRLGVPNKAMQEARAWLEQVAKVGGPLDLEFCWECWTVPSGTPPTINPKLHLLAWFEQLKDSCGARWHALYLQAERETLAERAAAELRSRLHRERDAAAAIERDRAAARSRASRIEAELALLEREMGGETLQ
jgi:hypothetical protein